MTDENVEASRLQPGGLGGKAEFRISTPKISKAVLRQTADRLQANSAERVATGLQRTEVRFCACAPQYLSEDLIDRLAQQRQCGAQEEELRHLIADPAVMIE